MNFDTQSSDNSAEGIREDIQVTNGLGKEATFISFETSRRLSQDQMQIFVSPEVIFQGCLSDFILWFLKSTDEAVSENVYISYNILYCGIYFY